MAALRQSFEEEGDLMNLAYNRSVKDWQLARIEAQNAKALLAGSQDFEAIGALAPKQVQFFARFECVLWLWRSDGGRIRGHAPALCIATAAPAVVSICLHAFRVLLAWQDIETLCTEVETLLNQLEGARKELHKVYRRKSEPAPCLLSEKLIRSALKR